mgnify:CR=1 FL=1
MADQWTYYVSEHLRVHRTSDASRVGVRNKIFIASSIHDNDTMVRTYLYTEHSDPSALPSCPQHL